MDNVDNYKHDSTKSDITLYEHNNFPTARKSYSTIAQHITRMAISDIRPRLTRDTDFFSEEFGKFSISIGELKNILKETSDDKFKKKIKLVIKELWKPIRVGDQKNFTEFVIFDCIEWDEKKGIRLNFSRTMKECLIDLGKGNYTQLQLKAAFQLTSSYSLTLLDLILQYRGLAKNGIIERVIRIGELRISLNIPEDSYADRIDNFRKRIIDTSIKEINEKTEFHIFPDYELLRGKYNKVTGFCFKMALPQNGQFNDVKENPDNPLGKTAKRALKLRHAKKQ